MFHSGATESLALPSGKIQHTGPVWSMNLTVLFCLQDLITSITGNMQRIFRIFRHGTVQLFIQRRKRLCLANPSYEATVTGYLAA